MGLLLFCSCKPKGNNVTANKTSKEDTTHFFPVVQYLQSQIADVDGTPYFIYKIDAVNGRKDSIAINTPVFKELAAKFLQPDINDKALKKHYRESIFDDQTTKSFTISYTTDNKELEIQNIDVLLQQDGRTVKRVFIRKFFNYPDSSAIEQLSWKPGERFQINRLVQKPGNKESSSETDVIWNEKS